MKINVIKKSNGGVKVDSICPWLVDVMEDKARS